MSVLRLLGYGVPLALDAGATALVLDGRALGGLGLHVLATALAHALTRRWLDATPAGAVGPGIASVPASKTRSVAAASAAALVLALPVVGAAVLAFVAWPSWSRRSGRVAAQLVEVALPDGSIDLGDPAAIEQAREPRPIRQLLRDAGSPDERVRAVMALRHMDARRAVPLLRLAFSHESEDVRLLAFGILEQREKRLRARIERSERRLLEAHGEPAVPCFPSVVGMQQEGGQAGRPEEGVSEVSRGWLSQRVEGPDAERPTGSSSGQERSARSRRDAAARPARWHQRLARDHWELVYGGFVSGDLEPTVLAKARDHAQAALACEPDARMAVLLARIYLRRRQPEPAKQYLEQAQRAGLPAASVAPLLAEVAFQLRRFEEIPTILRGVRRAELRRPELAPVADYWTGEA